MNHTNTANVTKLTASEIMAAQDRKDVLIKMYAKATTESQRSEIEAEYRQLEAKCDAYFKKKK